MALLPDWLHSGWQWIVDAFGTVKNVVISIFAAVITILAMLKDWVPMIFSMVDDVLAALTTLFNAETTLNLSGALDGAPADVIVAVNAFVPLQEVLAGLTVYVTTVIIIKGIALFNFLLGQFARLLSILKIW